MRVLHVLHESPLDPRGGLGVHVAGLASAQVVAGAEVTVLGMAQSHHGGLFVVDGNAARSVTAADWHGRYRVAHSWNLNRQLNPDGPYGDIANIENYLATILNIDSGLQVDVVHLHDAYLAPIATVLAAWQRCPIVVTSHLSCTLYATGLLANKHYQRCAEREVQTYHGASRLITVSKAYAQRLRDELLVPNVTVIPNGVDADVLSSIGRLFRPRSKVAAFIGRLVRQKGIGAILDAAKLLPDWHFIVVASVCVGAEQLYELAADMAERLSNVVWVRNAGYGLDRWQHVREASVALMPSLHEPFGIAALEWMALGIPLITSRIDGLAEFCNDSNSWSCGITGSSVAEALTQFERDDARIETAKKTVRRYTWAEAAVRTLEVYCEAQENTLAA